MFSSRSKNALTILIYLYENQSKGFIPLKTIAFEEDLSLKYLEQIMPPLLQNHLVKVRRGKEGGYSLAKEGDQITVWEILNIFEQDLYPVIELKNDEDYKLGKTKEMWQEFYQLEKEYFQKQTIADLAKKETVLDYVI